MAVVQDCAARVNVELAVLVAGNTLAIGRLNVDLRQTICGGHDGRLLAARRVAVCHNVGLHRQTDHTRCQPECKAER